LFLPTVVGVVVLYYLGILSLKELCGFRPGALAKEPGKEWNCVCIGKVDNISSSYSEKDYCTGLNLSYNRLMGLFYKGEELPVYKRQRP